MQTKLFTMMVLTSLLLSACGGQAAPAGTEAAANPTQAAPTASAPLIMHEGWTANPDTLNPAYAFLTQSYTIFDLIYGTLTTEFVGRQVCRRAREGLVGGIG